MRRAVAFWCAMALILGGCSGPDERTGKPGAPAKPAPQVNSTPREMFEQAFGAILSGRFDRAVRELGRIKERPDRGAERADDVEFWLAYCKHEAGLVDEAREAYAWVEMSRPEGGYAPVASGMREAIDSRPR